MLTVRGKYINGQVRLMEEIPFDGEYEVLITFLTDEDSVLVLPKSEYQDSAKHALMHRLGLTSREMDVLQLMQPGYTNRQIALRLNLSHGTVRNIASSIYKKMGVKNRTEAVTFAIEQGVLEL